MGYLSDVMMRETAGIQVGIDFKSEEDAMRKFRLANLIMPFSTAMFANSKIRGGVDTGYKSFRALAWLNTDNERCGFATDFNKKMCFKDFINKNSVKFRSLTFIIGTILAFLAGI